MATTSIDAGPGVLALHEAQCNTMLADGSVYPAERLRGSVKTQATARPCAWLLRLKILRPMPASQWTRVGRVCPLTQHGGETSTAWPWPLRHKAVCMVSCGVTWPMAVRPWGA